MRNTISARGIALIKEFEGLSLSAYPDPATGGEPWTIGYGHTGPEVRPGMKISIAKAVEYLEDDLRSHARNVNRLCKGSNTPQAAFDALVSFDFNTGALHRSTLLRRHRAGLHQSAAAEFPRWKYAGGKPMAGLIRRRKAERAMYASAYAATDVGKGPKSRKPEQE